MCIEITSINIWRVNKVEVECKPVLCYRSGFYPFHTIVVFSLLCDECDDINMTTIVTDVHVDAHCAASSPTHRSHKETRCMGLDIANFPESYRTNVIMEKVTLEYVEKFRRRFYELHPTRRVLLMPTNECGITVRYMYA